MTDPTHTAALQAIIERERFNSSIPSVQAGLMRLAELIYALGCRDTIQQDAKWMRHTRECAKANDFRLDVTGMEYCCITSCGLADRLKGAE